MYWIYRWNCVYTLSLRLICCTTNNLRNKILVLLSAFFGFLKDNLKGHCRHSLRFHSRDCVPSPSINRRLKMPEKAPIRIELAGIKLKRYKDWHPFGWTTKNWVTTGRGGHHGSPMVPTAEKAMQSCHGKDATIRPSGPPRAVVVATVQPWYPRPSWKTL